MSGFAPPLTPLLQIWWSWRRELNPRPSDYKSDALPAELRQRRSNRTRITDWALVLQEMDSKLLGGKPEATVEKCPLSVHPSSIANYIIFYNLIAGRWTGLPHNPQLSTPF